MICCPSPARVPLLHPQCCLHRGLSPAGLRCQQGRCGQLGRTCGSAYSVMVASPSSTRCLVSRSIMALHVPRHPAPVGELLTRTEGAGLASTHPCCIAMPTALRARYRAGLLLLLQPARTAAAPPLSPAQAGSLPGRADRHIPDGGAKHAVACMVPPGAVPTEVDCANTSCWPAPPTLGCASRHAAACASSCTPLHSPPRPPCRLLVGGGGLRPLTRGACKA